MTGFPKPTRAPKYGNKRVAHEYGSFGSQLEAAVHTVLRSRENAGEIRILQAQDHVYLSRAEIHYIPDFKCLDVRTGVEFWVEAKGLQTAEWRIKLKLWRFYGPGKLEIWKGTHQRPFLAETVIPRQGGVE